MYNYPTKIFVVQLTRPLSKYGHHFGCLFLYHKYQGDPRFSL